MARRLLLILLLAGVAALGGAWWQQRRRADAAEWRAGIDATRVVALAFRQASALEVMHLSGTLVTRTDAAGCLGLCAGTQATRAPFGVDYVVDLAHLPSSAFRWDAGRRTMTVTLPDVTARPPNVDLARASVEQHGVVISRAMGRALQAQAAANLAAKAAAVAAEPATMIRAREAARGAVARLVAAPLDAAGLGRVTVRVRFPFDAGRDDSRWDVSRPIDEVLADPRFR